MLGDPGLVLGSWERFFGTVLNAKSDKLRLGIIEGLPQRPVTHFLRVEPGEDEVMAALRLIAKVKAVRPNELLVELLKVGLNRTRSCFESSPDGQARVAQTEGTVAVARCHDKRSAQK